jgi:hypothetical protein
LPSIINASNSGFGGIVSTGDSSGVLQLQAAGTTIATIQSTGLNLGSNGVVFSDSSSQTAAASPYVLKNRIINGDMRIDQRNAGASVTPTTSGTYTLDRWQARLAQASKYSVQQNAGSVTPPAGFNNYLGVTSLSAYSLGSDDTFGIQQLIEGYNTADLAWGTANAKTVTLSFWVRSSLTGTFGGAIRNDAGDRSYPFTYTINSANTWELETITIAGDTTGTWLKTNGIGIAVQFGLGAGATYSGTAGAWAGTSYTNATGATQVVATNGATFYITGVQLEVGSTATPFERRLYNQELANCQRYALMIKNGTTSIDRFGLGSTVNSTTVQLLIQHPVAFRAAPTLTTTGTASDYAVYSTAVTTCNAAPTLGEGSQFNSRYNFVTAGGLTGGQVAQCQGANTNAYLLLSAEL